MDADLDTLATALYVTTDDLLKCHPERVPPRPKVGIAPRITDAELLTLAVMQALLGYTSETRWLRYARQHLAGVPHLPGQSGYNKRLRKLADTMTWLIAALAADTNIAGDDVWLVDSTLVECGRSRETVKRSDLAGWAEYGYCASHSRFFWGLRLHLVCTVHGLPLGWALTGAKADEREVLADLLASSPLLTWTRDHQPTLIGDKNYHGKAFEADLAERRVTLLRPTARASDPAPVNGSSNRCGSSSSRSTTPSKASSTSNATAAAPSPGSAPAPPNASSPSPPRSGTTTTSGSASAGH